MDDDEIRRMAEFAVPFTCALVELRRARDAGTGAELTADQVVAVIDALQILRTMAVD